MRRAIPIRSYVGAHGGSFTACLIGVLTLLFCGPSFAEAQEPECLEEARSIYAAMSALSSSSRYIDMRYTVHTTMRDSAHVPASESSVTARMSRTLLHVTSPEFESIRDTISAATAIHATRSIYVMDSPPNHDGADNDPFAMLRDSLLMRGTVIECRDVAGEKGESLRRVVVGAPIGIRRGTGVERITLLYDPAMHVLHTVTIGYTEPSPIFSVTLTFDFISYGVENTEIEKLDREEHADIIAPLRARYEGYQVVDYRKNRRNHQ